MPTLIEPSQSWLHFGCRKCGRVGQWPDERANEPLFCNHGGPFSWGTHVSGEQMVPVQVVEA